MNIISGITIYWVLAIFIFYRIRKYRNERNRYLQKIISEEKTTWQKIKNHLIAILVGPVLLPFLIPFAFTHNKTDSKKDTTFHLYGNTVFYGSTPLKGTNYVKNLPENLFIQSESAKMLGYNDPIFGPCSIKTIAEESNWILLGELHRGYPDILKSIKSCYHAAIKDGIYEAANNLGVLAINYEDNKEEGERLLNLAFSNGSVNAMINSFTYLWTDEKYLEACAMLESMLQRENPSLKCLWNLAYLYFMGKEYPHNTIEQDKTKAKEILYKIIHFNKEVISEDEKEVPQKAMKLLSYMKSGNIYADKAKEYHHLLTSSVIISRIKDKGEVFSRLSSLKLEKGYHLGLKLADMNTSEIGDVSDFYVYDNDGNIDWDIIKYLHAQPTAMSAWQIYLLLTSKTIMPVFWHGGYIFRKFIFKSEDLETIEPLASVDIHLLSDNGFVLPQVSIRNDSDTNNSIADIVCCYWNEWKGLVREHTRVRFNGNNIESCIHLKDFIVYEYNCGR